MSHVYHVVLYTILSLGSTYIKTIITKQIRCIVRWTWASCWCIVGVALGSTIVIYVLHVCNVCMHNAQWREPKVYTKLCIGRLGRAPYHSPYSLLIFAWLSLSHVKPSLSTIACLPYIVVVSVALPEVFSRVFIFTTSSKTTLNRRIELSRLACVVEARV